MVFRHGQVVPARVGAYHALSDERRRVRSVTAFALRRVGALVAVVVLTPAVTFVFLGSVYGSIYGHVTVWHQIAVLPRYLVRVFGHLDLGYDEIYRQPVGATLRQGLPVDLALMLVGLVVGSVAGVLLGLLAGPRPRTVADSALLLGATVAMSVPVYLLGAIVLYELAPGIGAHPIAFLSGPGIYRPITQSPLRWLHALWVPWCIVGAPLGAVAFRMTRSVLREGMEADWIRTARAKGLPERLVIRRHALRIGLPTVLEAITVSVPAVVANTILLESAMELPGMFVRFDVSRQVAYSFHTPSFPVIQGLVLDGAVLIGLGIFICEVLRGWLDPQVRTH
jgi:peptide/nickel transport system permease protein